MKRRRAQWDFEYEPVGARRYAEALGPLDLVVATRESVDPRTLREALRPLGDDVEVAQLIDRAPVHWTRLRTSAPASRLDIAGFLARAQLDVRYVASARTGSTALPPPLDFRSAPRVRPDAWSVQGIRTVPEPQPSGGRWFLGKCGGVHVDRHVCGTGAYTRLAVVDDDAADFESVELDCVVRVGLESVPAASGHGALVIGWAVGAPRAKGGPFVGIAPDASVRAYCIPKPGNDVVSLALAIARAALEGADVIICATHVEGANSPMLDDALDVAVVLGRRGRGTAVVFPTGRETSSPGGSVHASLSLDLGDPASDPRAHCVAPGGRRGGWFLWRDPRGTLRPFANRGPAVRWLAPGDDLAYPFASRERLFHAESSGASAVAAGVLLLLLGCNPRLRLDEIHALLARTAETPDGISVPETTLADPADVLPIGRDRDGHDAKCGYGHLHAARACASARDPVALELASIGEDAAASSWCLESRRTYSPELARWAVRALLARPDLEHALRVILRHARLAAVNPARVRAHAPGALSRQVLLLVRELLRCRSAPPPSPRVADELNQLSNDLRRSPSAFEETALATFAEVWA